RLVRPRGSSRRHAEAIVIESQSERGLTVQHAKWIKDDPAFHAGLDGFQVCLSEFRPGRWNDKHVRPLTTFDRADALLEQWIGVNGQLDHRIIRPLAAQRNAREKGQ